MGQLTEYTGEIQDFVVGFNHGEFLRFRLSAQKPRFSYNPGAPHYQEVKTALAAGGRASIKAVPWDDYRVWEFDKDGNLLVSYQESVDSKARSNEAGRNSAPVPVLLFAVWAIGGTGLHILYGLKGWQQRRAPKP